MTPDPFWQVAAMASVTVGVPVGLALRRWVEQLDRRIENRRGRR